jgi:uncharacterized RDD family membrane protein YckC
MTSPTGPAAAGPAASGPATGPSLPWAGAPSTTGDRGGTVDVEGLRLPAELVTGEAVALELRPASFAGRSLAWLLDAFLYLGLLVVSVTIVGGLAAGLDEAATAAIFLVDTVGFLVGLPVAIETVTRGRSVGKLAAGLRVVRDDGGPIRFRQALVRGLLAVVEVFSLPFVAVISSLVSPHGKRVGDLLAGTYVVRERGGVEIPPPVAMPLHLAQWAGSADIGRIPERLALAARGYLGRAASLHPQARTRLGTSLADQVSRYVAPTPPSGTYPEHFLAAVLAERTRRELDRLGRAQAARAARTARRDAAPVLAASSHKLVGED